MNSKIDWLPMGVASEVGDGDDIVYPLDELRSKFDVRELDKLGRLVLYRKNADDLWLFFAVMTFAHSEMNGANTMRRRPWATDTVPPPTVSMLAAVGIRLSMAGIVTSP